MYLQLKIVAVKDETPGTRTYYLENTAPEPVVYQAGQFLTFIIQLYNKEHRRSYSFSSTPGIDEHMAVTIREKENGEISRYLLRTWKPGDIITAVEPSGRFTFEPATGERDIFLMAAGSGITPVFSLLKQMLREEPAAKITLIYSNTTPERTIFYEQLRTLENGHPRLKILFLFSNDPDNHHTYRRLNNILLELLVNEHLLFHKDAAQFFLCGPPEYMRMILLTLHFMGFGDAQLHKENFVITTEAKLARTSLPTDDTPRQVNILLRNETYTLAIPANQTILSYALEHDVPLPYSCKGGVCGSCTALCTSGKVWMSVNEVLTDKELAEGLVLTCVGYPVSDQIDIEL